jgi:hypothetical protein
VFSYVDVSGLSIGGFSGWKEGVVQYPTHSKEFRGEGGGTGPEKVLINAAKNGHGRSRRLTFPDWRTVLNHGSLGRRWWSGGRSN